MSCGAAIIPNGSCAIGALIRPGVSLSQPIFKPQITSPSFWIFS